MSTITKISLLSLVAILVSAGAIFGLKYITKNYIETSNKAVGDNAQNTSLKFNLLKSGLKQADELNILLLGISGENYISGNLTDSIILANINLKSQKINLISIPRDLWVNDGSCNKQKINELYKINGGKTSPNASYASLLKERVSEVTRQNIQYTVVIDLDGIKNIVDLIGGIETEEIGRAHV